MDCEVKSDEDGNHNLRAKFQAFQAQLVSENCQLTRFLEVLAEVGDSDLYYTCVTYFER